MAPHSPFAPAGAALLSFPDFPLVVKRLPVLSPAFDRVYSDGFEAMRSDGSGMAVFA